MAKSIDIHNMKKRLEQVKTRLESSKINNNNKKKIKKYLALNQANDLSIARVEKITQTLLQIGKMIKKDFVKMGDDDVIGIFAKINQAKTNRNQDWSEWTKSDHKKIFKKFYYKFIKGYDEYPPGLKLKIGTPKSNNIVPENLLTVKEITKVASVTDKVRDKALVYVLYESGARIGELLSMRIGDVHFDKFGALLDVTGKTGSRRIRIITSKQILMDWINQHPLKEVDSPLWVDAKKKSLKYSATVRVLQRLFKRTNIKKKFNPHLFRHSRATHLAKLQLNEAMLKKFFGWSEKSEMASFYVHLAESDVDNALLELHGIEIKKEGKKLEKAFRSIICPACNRELTPDVKICPCGMIFDRTLTRQRMIDHKVIDEMLSVDWFKDAFEKRLKEMGYVKKG